MYDTKAILKNSKFFYFPRAMCTTEFPINPLILLGIFSSACFITYYFSLVQGLAFFFTIQALPKIYDLARADRSNGKGKYAWLGIALQVGYAAFGVYTFMKPLELLPFFLVTLGSVFAHGFILSQVASTCCCKIAPKPVAQGQIFSKIVSILCFVLAATAISYLGVLTLIANPYKPLIRVLFATAISLVIPKLMQYLEEARSVKDEEKQGEKKNKVWHFVLNMATPILTLGVIAISPLFGICFCCSIPAVTNGVLASVFNPIPILGSLAPFQTAILVLIANAANENYKLITGRGIIEDFISLFQWSEPRSQLKVE